MSAYIPSLPDTPDSTLPAVTRQSRKAREISATEIQPPLAQCPSCQQLMWHGENCGRENPVCIASLPGAHREGLFPTLVASWRSHRLSTQQSPQARSRMAQQLALALLSSPLLSSPLLCGKLVALSVALLVVAREVGEMRPILRFTAPSRREQSCG